MVNKYIAALGVTVVFGVLFPLSYQVLTQDHLHPIAVAASAALVFFAMLAMFGKILCRLGQQR
jgi:hypothetical protein